MKIHLLGDSLVQTKQPTHTPFYGSWGEALLFFLRGDVTVFNYALGGRSSRSFLNEGRFYDKGIFTVDQAPRGMGPALPRIEKGDYVLIHFMTNDDSSPPFRTELTTRVPLGQPDENGIYPTIKPTEDMLVSTDYWIPGYPERLYEVPNRTEKDVQSLMETVAQLLKSCGDVYFPYDCPATYKGYLKVYIDMVREKGAIPILVIPPCLHMFSGDKILPVGGVFGGRDAYNEFTYVEAVRQLSRETDTPAMDLFTPYRAVYEYLGPDLSSYFHNISIAASDIANIDALYDDYAKAVETQWLSDYNRRRATGDFLAQDYNHSNHFGAFYQAAVLVENLIQADILTDCLLTTPKAMPGVPDKLVAHMEYLKNRLKFVKL